MDLCSPRVHICGDDSVLSEERIKKMIRLSDYEAGWGEQDLRRARYSEQDYVALQVLRTIAGMIAASILVLGMVIVYYIDQIPFKSYVSEGFFTLNRLLVIAGILAGWLIVMGVAAYVTSERSHREYAESMLRVNEYELTLNELLRLYEAEDKEESE